MASKADQIVDLKNSVRAERGHFTRLFKASERALDFAIATDSPAATDELVDTFGKFKAKTDKVIEVLGELAALDAEDYDTYDANIRETQGTYEKVSENVLGKLKDLKQLPTDVRAAPTPNPHVAQPRSIAFSTRSNLSS